ncbi:MAG: hypothetical protein M3146_06705 [Thermoproteota archaeon]|nr:hypothetical protein [Thermoproteota archaeon]
MLTSDTFGLIMIWTVRFAINSNSIIATTGAAGGGKNNNPPLYDTQL